MERTAHLHMEIIHQGKKCMYLISRNRNEGLDHNSVGKVLQALRSNIHPQNPHKKSVMMASHWESRDKRIPGLLPNLAEPVRDPVPKNKLDGTRGMSLRTTHIDLGEFCAIIITFSSSFLFTTSTHAGKTQTSVLQISVDLGSLPFLFPLFLFVSLAFVWKPQGFTVLLNKLYMEN